MKEKTAKDLARAIIVWAQKQAHGSSAFLAPVRSWTVDATALCDFVVEESGLTEEEFNETE